MPDRTDSGQGRDALDAALRNLETALDAWRYQDATMDEVYEELAAVRKAAREMGEECVVEELLYGERIVSVQTLKPGDRVRVVKVEPDA